MTARAAAALARRFDEPDTSDHAPTTQQPSPAPTAAPPHAASLSPDEAKQSQRRAEAQIPASVTEHSGGGEGKVGVSPQQDVFYQPSAESSTHLSGLPRVKVPKSASDVQVSAKDGINADVFHTSASSKDAPAERTPSPEEQGEIPDEVMSQVFHSPRVARVLSQKAAKDGFNPYRLAAQKNTPPRVGREAEKVDSVAADQPASPILTETPSIVADVKNDGAYQMTESRVPSSRLGRLWQYSGLATSMALGAMGEGLRRATGSHDENAGSIMFSAGNMERLVAKLSKMRGAALKLGQMLSFQDSKMLPDSIQQVLQRVQDRADYMPASQRDKVLADNLGPNWRDLYSSFDDIPMAAASIGQVHGAVLKKTGQRVAVKVQYPGVADSIDSDLNNLSILLTASRLLPRGLYLDKTIANARTELAWECDYLREAQGANRFRALLHDDPTFLVPEIIPEASGKQVLTMERVDGVAVTKVQDMTQDQRDWIGTHILRLCLREIIEFQYMQTDPNWTNFLYNASTNRLELLDFGASREFPRDFISKYVSTLLAASRGDRQTCQRLSIELGYLTGHESPAMVDAHVTSIVTLAEPYMASSPDVYDFSNQTITDRVRDLIPVMIRERLAPPPEETYSLHRKLSGAFLLCARLGSRVRCKDLFNEAVRKAEKSGMVLETPL
ncbi:ATP binding cassette 1 protein [Aspergillus taichungensis]|uniref:ATP binding cassette 1 protein n=1 Tax=Aspergillus taichungensis TaxID=482145 RepID=A0A2J5I1E9_9EURO|nr:ATP binding cassette 1 protein [Aspergillus taichungensis]